MRGDISVYSSLISPLIFLNYQKSQIKNPENQYHTGQRQASAMPGYYTISPPGEGLSPRFHLLPDVCSWCQEQQ